MSITKNKMWMTLIEIIIALWVFSIWILWILNLMTYTISTTDKLNIQTTANMLASQSLEALYHQRDTNFIKYQQRDCIQENSSWSCTLQLSNLINKSWDNNYNIIIPTLGTNNFKFINKKITDSDFINILKETRYCLEKQQINNRIIYQYNYCKKIKDSQKINTNGNFWVFLTVNKIINLPREDILSWNIYKINSWVYYQKWAYTWKIQLESFISNLDKDSYK